MTYAAVKNHYKLSLYLCFSEDYDDLQQQLYYALHFFKQ